MERIEEKVLTVIMVVVAVAVRHELLTCLK